MLVDPKLEARPFEVLKWYAGQMRRVLVLSPLVGINSHFLGSSKICAGEGCPACRSGVPAKYSGYVCVLFSSTVRLLRLTSAAAYYGNDQAHFVPGRVLEVIKQKERQPLSIVSPCDAKDFDRAAVIGRVELLSTLAALHGLPRMEPTWSFEQCVELMSKNARQSCRLALKGLSS